MWSSKIKEDVDKVPINNIFEQVDRMNQLIDRWVNVELVSPIAENSKMKELTVFNLKTIYSGSERAKAMREFFFRDSLETSKEDYLFGRILDLYIEICMELSTNFVEHQQDRFVDALHVLGYPVDSKYVESLPFGWLLSKLQFRIRYRILTKQ